MNRRSFFKTITGCAAGIYVVFAPKKQSKKTKVVDVELLEDNRVHKCIPGSGPKHYVGQVLKYRGNEKKWMVCKKVLNDSSLWKEYTELCD